MNTEQGRADFEAWYADAIWGNEDFKQSLERAYQAGRSAGIRDGRAAAYDSASRIEQMKEDGL